MTDPVGSGVKRIGWRVAALLLVLAAAGLFVQRGVARGVAGAHDLTMMYAGARQWVGGGNPYPLDAAYDAYLDGGGGAERPRDPKWFAQLYPPTTYAVMAPVGALPWSVARGVFCGLNLAGWALAGWWAWGWRPRVGGGSRALAALLLAAGLLAWAPVHTTLAFGQLGGVVVGLVCLGVGRPERQKRLASGDDTFFVFKKGVVPFSELLQGLALAAACCLKPQLAGLFVVVLGLTGRWRTVAADGDGADVVGGSAGERGGVCGHGIRGPEPGQWGCLADDQSGTVAAACGGG